MRRVKVIRIGRINKIHNNMQEKKVNKILNIKKCQFRNKKRNKPNWKTNPKYKLLDINKISQAIKDCFAQLVHS